MTCDVDDTGRVRPMAVRSASQHLMVAFWRPEEDRPDVFAMPNDVAVFQLGPEWTRLQVAQVGPGATWAWNWALSDVNRKLDGVLRRRALPVSPFGVLGREAAWVAACALVKENMRASTGSIELDRLATAIDELPPEIWQPGTMGMRAGVRIHHLHGLRALVAHDQARGAAHLTSPLPPADQPPLGGGYIGDYYSDERLAEVATKMYELVIAGYREIVERWMPTLLSQLEHYVLMPMRVVGFVNSGRDHEGLGPIPHLAGYMEALPIGSADEVEIQIAAGRYDYGVGQHSFAQQRAQRPEAARWLSGSHGGMSFELGRDYPITDAVYSWIARDLKRLGLVGSLAWGRANEATVVFDLESAPRR